MIAVIVASVIVASVIVASVIVASVIVASVIVASVIVNDRCRSGLNKRRRIFKARFKTELTNSGGGRLWRKIIAAWHYGDRTRTHIDRGLFDPGNALQGVLDLDRATWAIHPLYIEADRLQSRRVAGS